MVKLRGFFYPLRALSLWGCSFTNVTQPQLGFCWSFDLIKWCSIDSDLKCPTLQPSLCTLFEHPTHPACLSYMWSQCRRSRLTSAIKHVAAADFWHRQKTRSRLWASGIPQGSSPPQSNCWTVDIWWSRQGPQPVLHLSSQLRSGLNWDKFDKSLGMWVQCASEAKKAVLYHL